MSSSMQEFVRQQPMFNQRRKFLHPLLRVLLHLLIKVEATGLENIPNRGATILMMNHINSVDPAVFTGIILDRYVISMAKAETMNSWFSRFVVKSWGNFLVRRETVDREALNNAIDLLRLGELVLIAPEGTRNPNGLEEAKTGIPYIAHKSDAIVVPAAICGVQDWLKRVFRLRRGYARVVLGKPFKFKLPEGEKLSREVREQMITEAMYQLALAIPDEFASLRGVYKDVQSATTKYIEFV